jgi:hypothetical protein
LGFRFVYSPKRLLLSKKGAAESIRANRKQKTFRHCESQNSASNFRRNFRCDESFKSVARCRQLLNAGEPNQFKVRALLPVPRKPSLRDRDERIPPRGLKRSIVKVRTFIVVATHAASSSTVICLARRNNSIYLDFFSHSGVEILPFFLI